MYTYTRGFYLLCGRTDVQARGNRANENVGRCAGRVGAPRRRRPRKTKAVGTLVDVAREGRNRCHHRGPRPPRPSGRRVAGGRLGWAQVESHHRRRRPPARLHRKRIFDSSRPCGSVGSAELGREAPNLRRLVRFLPSAVAVKSHEQWPPVIIFR